MAAKVVVTNIVAATSATVPVGIVGNRASKVSVHIKSQAGTTAHVLMLSSDDGASWAQIASFDLPDTRNEFDATATAGTVENNSEYLGFAVPSITGTIDRISVAGLL